MEQKDLDMIQSLLATDEELAQLWREHKEHEQKLDALAQRAYLTAEDQVEVKRLKKVKLAGRDRMEAILTRYRSEM